MGPQQEATDKRSQWCKMLLTREIARLEKNVGPADESPPGRRNALWLKQIGDSILTVAATIKRGAKEVSLVNIHTGTRETVPLNPKCTPEKNASLYHKKALKAERTESALTREQEITTSNLNGLRDALQQLTTALTSGEPEMVTTAIEYGITALERATPGITGTDPQKGAAPPYRHVRYNGWSIYIGKTDEQNDELSLRFAAGSDIWLHVAGQAGSHVLIKRQKGAPEPPDAVVNAAAALSAWYSKMRGSPSAEVHFTTARHVRKRQGAPAGQVLVEQWKSVNVTPQPPKAFMETGS